MTSVAVSWVRPRDVDGQFMESVIGVIAHDVVTGKHRIIPNGGTVAVGSGPNLSHARNEVVRAFLNTDIEWLWMVDTDMVFPPDTLDRLMQTAEDGPWAMVGGLCHGQTVTADGVELFPTIYYLDAEGRSARLDNYPPDQVIECHATGAACLLVHREVFEKLATEHDDPFPWFQEEVRDGKRFSEDITFCLRARAAGYRLVVDTGVDVGHVKPHVIDAARFSEWRSQVG